MTSPEPSAVIPPFDGFAFPMGMRATLVDAGYSHEEIDAALARARREGEDAMRADCNEWKDIASVFLSATEPDQAVPVMGKIMLAQVRGRALEAFSYQPILTPPPAAQAQHAEGERKAFEAFARGETMFEFMSLERYSFNDAPYVDEEVERAWRAWQARAGRRPA